MTQTDMILNHLRTSGSITPREALAEYGCMRLGARIYDLRQQGYRITAQLETTYNRFGKRVCYSRYMLHGGDAKQSGPNGAL